MTTVTYVQSVMHTFPLSHLHSNISDVFICVIYDKEKRWQLKEKYSTILLGIAEDATMTGSLHRDSVQLLRLKVFQTGCHVLFKYLPCKIQ